MRPTPVATVGKIWGIGAVFDEEGIFILLMPQFFPIQRGRWYRDPGLFFRSSVHLEHGLGQEGFHIICERLFHVLGVLPPYIRLPLSQKHGVVVSLELSPSPESVQLVTYDNEGGHPVLWDGLIWIRKHQTCLLDRELSDPLSWVFLLRSPKKRR